MTINHLEIVRTQSELLAKAAEAVPLDTPVPSCPGWDMAALVGHIGTIQTWVAHMVETLAQQRVDRKTLPVPPTGPEVIPYFRAATARMLTALTQANPDAAVWTFMPARRVSWWFRRQAHEATVHRWDAQNTVGNADDVDPALAVDGVDELLEMQNTLQPQKFMGDAGTVHLHATDAAGEWFLQLGASGMTVEHRHAKGDVAARGKAASLYLYVWGRIPEDTMEVFGDRALLSRLQRLTAM